MRPRRIIQYKKSNRYAYPAGVQVRYTKALIALVKKMTNGVTHEVMTFFRAHGAQGQVMDAAPRTTDELIKSLKNSYVTLFHDRAWQLAQQAVDEMDDASDSAVRINSEALADMMTIHKSLSDMGLKSELDDSVEANVALIKSIPEKYLDDVSEIIKKSFDIGRGLSDIYGYLTQRADITERRAKFIAEDQTRKTYNNLNAKRLGKVGLDKFEWIHSGGGQHPREYHMDVLNGQVFSFDDPPVIDEDTGEVGLPGDLPNCGCTFASVMPSDDASDSGAGDDLDQDDSDVGQDDDRDL